MMERNNTRVKVEMSERVCQKLLRISPLYHRFLVHVGRVKVSCTCRGIQIVIRAEIQHTLQRMQRARREEDSHVGQLK